MTNHPASPRALIFVAAYAALIVLPFLGSSRTLTSHEAMVTHPANRMLADGHWIVPHYASGLWLDKPPLVSWLTAGSFALFGGFSEFAARLPAALSAIGLSLLIAWLAGRLFGARAALPAGLVQATCVYTYLQGRLGEIDMTLTLLIAAAHTVLALRWARGQWDLPLGAAIAFHTFLGLAVLAKGAIAVAMVGSTILCFCAFRRTWRPLRAVVLTPSVACFLIVAGSWHVAAYMVTGQEAIDQWSYNSLLRFFGLHHLGMKSPLMYFWTVPWLVLPWTIALVIGARYLWSEVRKPEAYIPQFLWAWFFGGLAFLTICFFKHKHYVLPVLPPLAILCAPLVLKHIALHGVHARRFYYVVFTVIVILYGVVGAVVMPARDHRRVTADFVRTATGDLPAEQRLYVAGLGQSSVYPYIEHENISYSDSLDEIGNLVLEAGEAGVLLLTLHKHLGMPGTEQWVFTPIAAEPVRKKHPLEDTVVIGRVHERHGQLPSDVE